MLDFMGNTIDTGDWLVSGGGGNRKSEYGMILHRVIEVKPDSLRAVRLLSSYDNDVAECKAKKVTIKSGVKYIKVMPSDHAMALFMNIEDEMADQEDHERCAKWIHGSYQFEDYADEF